jgi:tripartite-type tricarboxylate transporter receptor subunit TctC
VPNPFKHSKVQGLKVLGLFSVLTLELLNPLNLERACAQGNFYQGKTLRVIVGSAPGGGYDQWAHLMAQHIGKHIPGHPTVIVQNTPGAGGVIAANFVYGLAQPDGLTMGAFNPAAYFEQLVGRPEIKFDWSKFTWIGSPEKK